MDAGWAETTDVHTLSSLFFSLSLSPYFCFQSLPRQDCKLPSPVWTSLLSSNINFPSL